MHRSLFSKLITGAPLPRLENLDEIPSPYLSGRMDRYFNGQFQPFIESARGCPYACTFCEAASDWYNKVNSFSIERIKNDLDYIALRVHEYPNLPLAIADSNFGMLKRDEEIAEHISALQKEYGWPNFFDVSTGKSQHERIISVAKKLNNKLVILLSVFNVALGEGEYVYFYEPKNGIGFDSSIFRSRVGNEYEKSKVRTDRLSNYLNGNVDLLKIDIEGSEFFVIEDLYDNNKLSLVQIVVMEFHNNVSDKNKLSPILKMFEDSGFKYQFSRPSHIKYEEEHKRDLYYDGYQTMILKAWNLSDPENRKFDL